MSGGVADGVAGSASAERGGVVASEWDAAVEVVGLSKAVVSDGSLAERLKNTTTSARMAISAMSTKANMDPRQRWGALICMNSPCLTAAGVKLYGPACLSCDLSASENPLVRYAHNERGVSSPQSMVSTANTTNSVRFLINSYVGTLPFYPSQFY